MIEVEIRGRLDKGAATKLRSFFGKKGTLVEKQSREMILLFDNPGYADDPGKREVDIRLRNTNGTCEIMVKRKAHEHNAGRSEVSLKLSDKNLENAKEIVKAFGCSRGLWMHRTKNVYRHNGIEWSIVEAVPHPSIKNSAAKRIFYFEAERAARDGADIEKIRMALVAEAERLGLSVFTPEQYYDFVGELGREVNKRVTW